MAVNHPDPAGGEPARSLKDQSSTPGYSPLGTCARCHQPLTRPGGCLRCIVNFVALDANAACDPVAGGEEARRYSHFEIVLAADGSLAELGHGAMGTTYRAIDTVLQSPVALKVISRNVADSPAVRARFLREARSAARLRHPNVASVFHYGEQDGECFYVMELVEGETLEERVRRDGPVSAPSVLEIGEQVAHALEAAEAQGLVHRDLKPSNLMLAAQRATNGNAPGAPPPLFVKVIDFGLAKAVTADPAAGENDTRHGFVGTPAYASPEQFARAGTDSRVDARSDFYSLGVTLWYLLCGRTPFRGQTLEEIHGRQVNYALPLDQLTEKRVPAPVVSLLRALLAVDPDERPQNPRELLERLRRCRASLLPPAHDANKRRWLAVGALLSSLALVAIGYRVLHKTTVEGDAAPVDRTVAVLPFDNRSPDANETFFAGGVQGEITAGLARSARLRVVSSASAVAFPPGRRDLVKISRELGVGHLVEGSVARAGDHVALTVQLVDASDATHPWTARYEGNLSEVFGLEGRIIRELALRLHAPFLPGETAALDEPMTRDPVAHDLYLRFTQAPTFMKGPEEFRRTMNEKLALLQQAVARDPNFVLAYCAIAGLHDDLFDASSAIVEERAVDHRSLAEVALGIARRLQPDSGEVHKLQAYHAFLVLHDPEQARIELDLARTTMPNDSEIEQTAGRIAEREGRWDEAARAFEKAALLDPLDQKNFDELANIYRCTRRYADADRALARILALGSPVGKVANLLNRAVGPLEERADLAPLRTALADLPASLDPADAGYPDPCRLILALCEHDPDAVLRILPLTRQPKAVGADNILAGRWIYPKAWFEGVAQRMRGDEPAARNAFAVARTALEKTLQPNPRDGRALSLLAMTDAGLGRKEDAVREGRQACELISPANTAITAPAVACHLAVAYAWTGEPDQAFALLENLVQHTAGKGLLFQPTYGDLRLNPVWDPLRADPRFAALVAKLAPKPTH